MNILILGLGSIGQRHLRNIKKINPKAQIFALRKKYTTPLLNNKNKVINGDVKRKYSITYLKDLSEIIKNKINIHSAFICTPSSMHVKQVSWLLKNNINCFIEKPLGSSLKGIKQLETLIKKKKNVKTMMGFQLRFNPIINSLEKIIKKKSPIGKIFSIQIHHGEHIEDFHPYEDYRISYAANKKLGGGVVLTQIHEIDYLMFLFKDYLIEKSNFISSKVSDLKINVEDTLSANFILRKNKNLISCSMFLNFFERPKKRKMFIIGKKGSIDVCFNSQKLIFYKNGKKIIKRFKFSKNDIFLKEIKFFFSKIKSNQKIPDSLNLYNGIKTLRFALKLNKFKL